MFDDLCHFDKPEQCEKPVVAKIEFGCRHGHTGTIFICQSHFGQMLIDDEITCFKCEHAEARAHKCPVQWDWEKLTSK